METRKSRRLPSAATAPGVKYRLLLRVYAAENLRNVSSHGTYCKVYVGNVDMAASRKGRQSFKKFLMSSTLSSSSSSSSSASTSSSYASSPAGSPDPTNSGRSNENYNGTNSSSRGGGGPLIGGIDTSGTRVREFKTQVQKFSRASPVWNEKFELASVDPFADLVSVRVKSARLMSSPAVGACCIPLRDVPEDETVDRWVALQDGKKDAGRIRVQMRLVRADAPPAVKKEHSSSSSSSSGRSNDPVGDDRGGRASARRTSSKRSNRSSNSSSLSRTRLSGSISPVAKPQQHFQQQSPVSGFPPRETSDGSSNSSNSHNSRSQTTRKNSRGRTGREAGDLTTADAEEDDHYHRANNGDSVVDLLEHVSETSSSSSSMRSVSGIASKYLTTATEPVSTTTTTTTTSSYSENVINRQRRAPTEEDDGGDVVEASTLSSSSSFVMYNSMQRIRDRGTMLSEVGASTSSSLRSNGSFVGSLHLYNRNSIATSTPSRTTMVMSETEIAALNSESSSAMNGGRRNGNADDRNSGQTEDTDSDDEYSEPETEGPRIPWNSTITRLLSRKSTNILIDEDEEEDDDDELHDHNHLNHDHQSVYQTLYEEVPILDFPGPHDIDEIDCA